MIELMVVIIIIGILSAIAIPTYAGHIDRVKIGRAVAELKSIKNLVELYKVENGEYPATTEIKDLLEANGLIGWESSMKDPWDRAYNYYADDNDLTKYCLWSTGPTDGEKIDNIVATQDNSEPLKDKELPTWVTVE